MDDYDILVFKHKENRILGCNALVLSEIILTHFGSLGWSSKCVRQISAHKLV